MMKRTTCAGQAVRRHGTIAKHGLADTQTRLDATAQALPQALPRPSPPQALSTCSTAKHPTVLLQLDHKPLSPPAQAVPHRRCLVLSPHTQHLNPKRGDRI